MWPRLALSARLLLLVTIRQRPLGLNDTRPSDHQLPLRRDAGTDRGFSGDLLLPRLGHVALGARRWRRYGLPVPGRASERVLRDVETPDRCEGPELRRALLQDVPVTGRSLPGAGR